MWYVLAPVAAVPCAVCAVHGAALASPMPLPPPPASLVVPFVLRAMPSLTGGERCAAVCMDVLTVCECVRGCVPAGRPGILNTLKNNGLNMVEVYVFWNYHEPLEGQVRGASTACARTRVHVEGAR
jgi:hypothetical protein